MADRKTCNPEATYLVFQIEQKFADTEIFMKLPSLLFAGTVALAMGIVAKGHAADPLVGKWKRPNGTIIEYEIAGNQFCGTVLNGEFVGKPIGCLTGQNGKYKGKVNKLDEGKTYSGKATVNGNKLTLAGCVFGGLICKSGILIRQK